MLEGQAGASLVRSFPDDRDCLADKPFKPREARNHLAQLKGSVAHDDRDVRADIYLVLEGSAFEGRVPYGQFSGDHVLAIAYKLEDSRPNKALPRLGKNQPDNIGHEADRAASEDRKPVLVADIHGVEFVDVIAPARVWFASLNRSPDIFRGELYHSSAQNTFLGIAAEPPNRKLKVVGALGVAAEDGEVGVIERRAQIVEGIPCDTGQFIGNGYVGLSRDGQPSLFWIEAFDQLEGALLSVGLNPPVQVCDMMLRSL